MKSKRTAIFIATCAILLVVATRWGAVLIEQEQQACYDIGYKDGKAYIPSIEEIQERIGAKPDGIIGPQTIKKWDAALGNQSADQYFPADFFEEGGE